jgi:hypothetical protein
MFGSGLGLAITKEYRFNEWEMNFHSENDGTNIQSLLPFMGLMDEKNTLLKTTKNHVYIKYFL